MRGIVPERADGAHRPSRTHRRSKMALTPLAIATAAIDVPGYMQLATASALNSSTKLQVVHFNLSRSRAFYIRASLLQTHEMLFDADNHAFRVFGGEPSRYSRLETHPK